MSPIGFMVWLPDPWHTTHLPLQALSTFGPGDAALIFVPDDLHYTIARACLEKASPAPPRPAARPPASGFRFLLRLTNAPPPHARRLQHPPPTPRALGRGMRRVHLVRGEGWGYA